MTEYTAGYIPLRQYLRNNDITLTDSQFIIRGIEDVIVLLHNNGISHGDINSSNILINPKTLQVKFIDFGLCSHDNVEDMEKDRQKFLLTKNFIEKRIRY